jgi:hypothetical protein
MIQQIDAASIASGQPAAQAIRQLRVVKFSQGNKFWLDSPNGAPFNIYCLLTYRWATSQRLFLPSGLAPGVLVVEVSSDPYEVAPLETPSPGGASDASGFSQITGAVANGASATGINPVLTAGWDGANVRTLSTDASGRAILAAATALISIANAVVSPAAPGTVVGPGVDITGFSRLAVMARTLGATSGTLDIYLQTRINGLWVDVLHLPQLPSGSMGNLGFATSLERGGGSIIVGVNNADGTPVLAVNTKVVGCLGDQLRYVFVAGAGTIAGAAQSIFAVGSAS